MDHKQYNNIFFLGAGGIGMSALARYFIALGKHVAGYDRTSTELTAQLVAEGMDISYQDGPHSLPDKFNDPTKTLVVFTPAVKSDNQLLVFFLNNNFTILKRAEILGLISAQYATIAVAGTHGKTTVSSLIAHLLYQSSIGCLAILGGIPKNYNTNYLNSGKPKYFVTEADEFDRSFLRLKPTVEVVTSADADHLDIYGTEEELKHSFEEFIGNLNGKGFLVIKEGLELNTSGIAKGREFKYSLTGGDYFAENLKPFPDRSHFDLVLPAGRIDGLTLGIPGQVNVENAVAASAVALNAGVSETELRRGLKSFNGIRRRYELQYISEQTVYIDDYAHHPEEISVLVNSVRLMFPDKRVTGVFQPHLYSRTKDFSTGFAESLDLMDEVILLDIYPAREKPIEGVTSGLIYGQMKMQEKRLCTKENLVAMLSEMKPEVLLTIGAGDIDRLVQPIKQMLKKTSKSK
jgi:UDP-N-acetylmuramate--alanine ligase